MNDVVIMEGAAFDLPTDNYEEFEQDIEPSRLGKKLVYKNSLKGTNREYQFYAAQDLLLDFVEKKNTKKFRINLAWLSPKPIHNKVIEWKWLYYALAAFALSGLCLYLATAQIFKIEYCAGAGAILLTAACISTLSFIYFMRDEYIFRSYFGGTELVLIENKKPNLSEFNDFFLELQHTIESTQKDKSIPDRLIGELKMTRRLKDEHIISDAQYTTARTVIFKHKQYKA